MMISFSFFLSFFLFFVDVVVARCLSVYKFTLVAGGDWRRRQRSRRRTDVDQLTFIGTGVEIPRCLLG